jgi:hypothetical protein
MIERIYDLTGRIRAEAQHGISEAEANQLRALLLSDSGGHELLRAERFPIKWTH